MENSRVILKVLEIAVFVFWLLFFMYNCENSGNISEENESIIAEGYIITGITIPWIIPYCESAVAADIPDFLSCIGISMCFIVESPDLRQELKATGTAILNMRFFIPFVSPLFL